MRLENIAEDNSIQESSVDPGIEQEKVRKFPEYFSFYYPQDKKIESYNGAYSITYLVKNNELYIIGASKESAVLPGGKIDVPADDEAIIRGRANKVFEQLQAEKME